MPKKPARRQLNPIRREFRQEARTGKTKVWIITVMEEEITIEHGLLDGKMQSTSRMGEAKNIGRANEKTPAEDAQDWASRQMTMKMRQGYREVDKKGEFLQYEDDSSNELVFSELTQNLRFYKPLNSLNVYLEKMLADLTAWLVRKRDGNMHIYVIDENGKHRMYSSTTTPFQKDEPGVDIIMRYPGIEMAMREIGSLQKKSIFLGEIVTGAAAGYIGETGFDVDDLDYVNGVRGGLLQSSLDKQNEGGQLSFCIWDIAFWAGNCLLHSAPYAGRLEKIRSIVDDEEKGFLTYPEVLRWDGSEEKLELVGKPGESWIDLVNGDLRRTALELAKDLDWEGWVVVDPNATYDDKAYNWRGKAERPKFCAKLKPKFEGDFIVRWDPDNGIGKRGKGKKSVGIGSVQSYLYDPRTREEIPVSLIGGGLSEEDVLGLADPNLYPMVWQVEYTSWTKSGSLQFPEFLRVRDDKKPDECEIYQNPDWEKHYA